MVIDDEAHQDLRKELASWFNAEANEDGELKRAEVRLAKLERVEKNLQRLAIEEEISFEDFKEHRTRIEGEKARLKNTVDAIKQRQHLVKADFEIALQLANELDFLLIKGTLMNGVCCVGLCLNAFTWKVAKSPKWNSTHPLVLSLQRPKVRGLS